MRLMRLVRLVRLVRLMRLSAATFRHQPGDRAGRGPTLF